MTGSKLCSLNTLLSSAINALLDHRMVRLAWEQMLRPYLIDSLKAVCWVSLTAHIKLIKLMDAAAGTLRMPLKYNSFMNNSEHWLLAIDHKNQVFQTGGTIGVSNMYKQAYERILSYQYQFIWVWELLTGVCFSVLASREQGKPANSFVTSTPLTSLVCGVTVCFS